jgi:hypothetical protein
MKYLRPLAIAGCLALPSAGWAACSIPKPPAVTTANLLSVYTDDQVRLTGGCIDGVAIGQNNPKAGAFTSLTANGLPVATGPTSWMPNDQSGAGLTFTGVTASYVKNGKLVSATFNLTWPTTANGSAVVLGGLPFAGWTGANSQVCLLALNATVVTADRAVVGSGTTTFTPQSVAAMIPTNAQMSGGTIRGSCTYFTD